MQLSSENVQFLFNITHWSCLFYKLSFTFNLHKTVCPTSNLVQQGEEKQNPKEKMREWDLTKRCLGKERISGNKSAWIFIRKSNYILRGILFVPYECKFLPVTLIWFCTSIYVFEYFCIIVMSSLDIYFNHRF